MSENHWAWGQPTYEFYPLGKEKLEALNRYIEFANWSLNGKVITTEKMKKLVNNDLRYASQIYCVYKKQIESMLEMEQKNISKQREKEIKKKNLVNCSEGKAEIIDFQAYRKAVNEK